MKLRKYAGIAFLLCLTIPLLSCYFYIRYQAKQVRREVKHQLMEGIDKEELVLLSFSQDEEKQLKWKHAKEFEYKGEMYDIVSRETTEGITHYWCWWDYEETKLNKSLSKLVNQILGKRQDHQQKQNLLVRLYKSLYFKSSYFLPVDNAITEEKNNNWLPNLYQSLYLSPKSPPPQINHV